MQVLSFQGQAVSLVDGQVLSLGIAAQDLAARLEQQGPEVWSTLRPGVSLGSVAALLASKELSPLLDPGETWAAGVTYDRSKVARNEESGGQTNIYDRVFAAERPELFMKAGPGRAVFSGRPLHARRDSAWQVPEPELGVFLNSRGQLLGFCVGDDLSCRDIEAENPLYLPQAKVWDRSLGVGLTLIPPQGIAAQQLPISLRITDAAGQLRFEAETNTAQMVRPIETLISFLTREYTLRPNTLLLTGTGIVPPADFTLQLGDVVEIRIADWLPLTNPVD